MSEQRPGDLRPGMTVTPTIRLVRALGAGGMGSVWVADHLALRTQVVVKFMSAELAASAEAVARFSREAAAAAQVKSPHVVQMLDHGVTPDGIPFIVMELLEGHDLAHHLQQRGGRISLQETATLIGQVAKALGRAHERGIVHRDIKPDNIFLTEVGSGDPFVKLLDFGIAKGADGGGALSGSGTKTGATIGTPYYMSPEQVVGAKTLDLRSDLWSLGVVAYQCVVGSVPFDAETFGALAVMINSGPLPQPSLAAPGTPPLFDAWFARACARDPAARFGSAKELADALAAIARGESIGPYPASAVGPRGAAAQGNAWPTGPSPSATTGPQTPLNGSTNGGVGLSASGAGTAPKSSAALAVAAVLGLLVLGGAVGGVVYVRGRSASAAGAASALASASASASASATASTSAVPLPSATASASASPGGSASVASVPTQPSAAPAPTGRGAAAPPRPTPTATHGAASAPTPPPPPPAPAPTPTKNEKDIF